MQIKVNGGERNTTVFWERWKGPEQKEDRVFRLTSGETQDA